MARVSYWCADGRTIENPKLPVVVDELVPRTGDIIDSGCGLYKVLDVRWIAATAIEVVLGGFNPKDLPPRCTWLYAVHC